MKTSHWLPRSLFALLRGPTGVLLFGIVVGGVGLSPVRAAEGGIPEQVAALQQSLQTLKQQVDQMTATANSQSALIAQLEQQNQDLQSKLGCMSKAGDDVYFTGCNVHIVNGSGATAGALNGLGNQWHYLKAHSACRSCCLRSRSCQTRRGLVSSL